jgi:hypothetical protein
LNPHSAKKYHENVSDAIAHCPGDKFGKGSEFREAMDIPVFPHYYKPIRALDFCCIVNQLKKTEQ